MNKKTLCGALCLLAVLAMGFSSVSAAERINKEKLQVFIMLGQSNMVGLADIKTFQYLLQQPYKPSFEEVEHNLKRRLYYRRIYSDYGYELEQKMHRDPKYFTMHPRTLRGVIRKAIIDTIPDDPKRTEKYIYDDMISRVEARIPLRKRMAERFIKGTTEADFEGLGGLVNEARNSPETKADKRAERLVYAKLVRDMINLPIAKRTYIANYGAFQAVDGDSNITRYASGPLSIGWGSGYTKIGPEYGFGIAMEEKLDAPILIIKCAWGNTQLAAAWRPPSAPPRTETAEQKALREAKNAALKAKAEADGTEFKPIEAPNIPSPGWCWTNMKFDEHIKKVLADPGKYHPEYDEKVGYEVAGMVWFQGYSDQSYKNGIEYKDTMKHFIHDLRKLTKTPRMPVVIGTTSALGDGSLVAQSQFAVAELDEFKGTVTTVDTMPFCPTELSILFDLMYQARKAGPEYKTSQQYAQWEKFKGASNRGYHYMGSAEFFVEASDAFATAMVGLMKEENQEQTWSLCHPVLQDRTIGCTQSLNRAHER